MVFAPGGREAPLLGREFPMPIVGRAPAGDVRWLAPDVHRDHARQQRRKTSRDPVPLRAQRADCLLAGLLHPLAHRRLGGAALGCEFRLRHAGAHVGQRLDLVVLTSRPDGREDSLLVNRIDRRLRLPRMAAKGLSDEVRGAFYAVLETPTGMRYEPHSVMRSITTPWLGTLVA